MVQNLAFLDCVHMMLRYFENGENVTDRPPVHTKTAQFCQQRLKTVDFENGTVTGSFRKRYRVNTRNDENRTFFDAFGTKLSTLRV